RAQIADASIGHQRRLDAFRKLEGMSDLQLIDLSDLTLRELKLDNHVFNKAVSFQSSRLIDSSLIATQYATELVKQFGSGLGNGFDFQNTIVTGTKFDLSDFRAATFDDARVKRTTFESTLLILARFNGATIDDVSFSRAFLTGADFSNATLDQVR